jgi:hypothetical protein
MLLDSGIISDPGQKFAEPGKSQRSETDAAFLI